MENIKSKIKQEIKESIKDDFIISLMGHNGKVIAYPQVTNNNLVIEIKENLMIIINIEDYQHEKERKYKLSNISLGHKKNHKELKNEVLVNVISKMIDEAITELTSDFKSLCVSKYNNCINYECDKAYLTILGSMHDLQDMVDKMRTELNLIIKKK